MQVCKRVYVKINLKVYIFLTANVCVLHYFEHAFIHLNKVPVPFLLVIIKKVDLSCF